MVRTKKLSPSYYMLFTMLLVMSGSNYSVIVKAEETNLISLTAQLLVAGTLAGLCQESISFLWAYLAKRPEVEVATMKQRQEAFDVQQNRLLESQQALGIVAKVIEDLGPHLPLNIKKEMQTTVKSSGTLFQHAVVKYDTVYRPEHQDYVDNL